MTDVGDFEFTLVVNDRWFTLAFENRRVIERLGNATLIEAGALCRFVRPGEAAVCFRAKAELIGQRGVDGGGRVAVRLESPTRKEKVENRPQKRGTSSGAWPLFAFSRRSFLPSPVLLAFGESGQQDGY